jgi:putative zinc finger/helix-turn-helix YgiT family protein
MYKCDICGSTDTCVKEHDFNQVIKGRSVSFKSNIRVCSKCNHHVYDAELDNIASTKALDEYRKKYGVLPADIINLRKKYKLTQEQFSKVIGCAKKTLVSYELGKSIPNDIYLIVIKTLLDNPEILPLLVESNKELYNLEEYSFYNNRLKDIINESELDAFNGYNELDFDKVYALISLLTKKGIYKTKLLKEMFYCDFLHYKRYCVSITGLKYAKLPYGPVPDKFEILLNDANIDNIITTNIEYKNNSETCKIISTNKVNYNFNKEELKTINDVIDFFKDYSVSKIVEYSHKEDAYKKTNDRELIDFTYAFDLSLN